MWVSKPSDELNVIGGREGDCKFVLSPLEVSKWELCHHSFCFTFQLKVFEIRWEGANRGLTITYLLVSNVIMHKHLTSYARIREDVRIVTFAGYANQRFQTQSDVSSVLSDQVSSNLTQIWSKVELEAYAETSSATVDTVTPQHMTCR